MPKQERCMEDREREVLAHVAAELRALASKTQWITVAYAATSI